MHSPPCYHPPSAKCLEKTVSTGPTDPPKHKLSKSAIMLSRDEDSFYRFSGRCCTGLFEPWRKLDFTAAWLQRLENVMSLMKILDTQGPTLLDDCRGVQ